MFLSSTQNRIHVSTLTKKMHSNDRFRFRTNLGNHLIRTKVVATLSTIYKNRFTPQSSDCACSSEKSVSRTNYLIARSDAHRLKCQEKCIRSIRNAYRVRYPNPFGNLTLKSLHLWTQNKTSAIQNTLKSSLQLRLVRSMLCDQIEHRNPHKPLNIGKKPQD